MMAEDFLKSILKLDPAKESNIPAALGIMNENLRRGLSLAGGDKLPDVPACPEERIQFLSKYYTWIPVDQDVLKSKTN